MYRRIITTVGTSLLTNRDRPWAGWRPQTKCDLPDPREVREWLSNVDPALASAETNTLRAMDVSEQDELVFLHSNTEEGTFCAARLAEYYEKIAARTTMEKIEQLGYSASNFDRGLKCLIDIVVKHVKDSRNRGQIPIICATGGFKAEIAFMNLIGALMEVEVFYMHELHKEVVRLPVLPLAWDVAFVEANKEFFTWVEEEPRSSSEVESWLKKEPKLRPLVEDADDGCTYLTSAGHMLYKVAMEKIQAGPRATWPPSDPRHPKEKNKVSATEHHRPRGWERFVDALCEIDCVSMVRYENTNWSGPKVKILNPEKGEICVRYTKDNLSLPLFVSTTARGMEQTQLVADYISKKVSKY
ncbi:CRISPR-associated protein, APE2256 family [Thermovirga lienii DSM 17291]|uniref:CRISPR-associated protein, APE2256 family n=1 Tax=Thermovirga lienii (strain ATCC BAA-1197 / DSM 17291 / Cas60314) TaxID=580340 RepID=G7V6E5_THELD|nr:putative CRISPR-associated protein [Thermovirga lienii]AER65974.1 CRISPR-associated protein, APE2256 family [Thermovirga lienii DSM 17291]